MTSRTPKRQSVYLGCCPVCGQSWTMAKGLLVDHRVAAPGIDATANCPGSGHLPIERERAVARTRTIDLRALAEQKDAFALAIEEGRTPAPYYRLVKGVAQPARDDDIDPATRRRQRTQIVIDTRLEATLARQEAQRIAYLASERFNGAFERERLPGIGDMVKARDLFAGPPMILPGMFGVAHRIEKREPGVFAIGIHWSTGASCTLSYPAQRVDIVEHA